MMQRTANENAACLRRICKRTTSGGSLQFPNGLSGKILFHLTSNRNFLVFLLNGKHPSSNRDCLSCLTYYFIAAIIIKYSPAWVINTTRTAGVMDFPIKVFLTGHQEKFWCYIYLFTYLLEWSSSLDASAAAKLTGGVSPTNWSSTKYPFNLSGKISRLSDTTHLLEAE